MKFFLAVFAILALFSSASAFVLPERMDDHQMDNGQMVNLEDVDTDGEINGKPNKPIIRRRRWTCDLLSFETSIVTPNHAACALKCIYMGRNGGHCEGTSCVCRDDKCIWGDFLAKF